MRKRKYDDNGVPIRVPSVGIDFSEDKQGRTRQEFKDDQDVNNIVSRFRSGGNVMHMQEGVPFYGDFTQASDYHSAVDAVMRADEKFMSLPAAVRAYVDNDPGQFLTALEDEATKEEMVKLGLQIESDVASEPTPPPSPPTPPDSPPPAE